MAQQARLVLRVRLVPLVLSVRLDLLVLLVPLVPLVRAVLLVQPVPLPSFATGYPARSS